MAGATAGSLYVSQSIVPVLKLLVGVVAGLDFCFESASKTDSFLPKKLKPLPLDKLEVPRLCFLELDDDEFLSRRKLFL